MKLGLKIVGAGRYIRNMDRRIAALDPAGLGVHKLMTRLGTRQIRYMKQRTLKGMSVEGLPFVKYSTLYGIWRLKHNRPETPPDLHFTGKYQGSWGQKELRPGLIRIGPGIGGVMQTHADLGKYLQKKRPHWGFTRWERQQHNKEFTDYVREAIRQGNG